MFIALALLVGVAIGYCVKDDPIPVENPVQTQTASQALADKSAEASIKALRHRVAELEKLLAEKNRLPDTPQQNEHVEEKTHRER